MDNVRTKIIIHGAPLGGWIVWDDTNGTTGRINPTAAFSSADDLLKWLERQLFPEVMVANSVISPTSNFVKTERQ